MAYFLFIDESGQDHHDSPYEVLAGVSMLDKDLWTFIRAAHEQEINCFGRKYRASTNERCWGKDYTGSHHLECKHCIK